MEAYRLYTIGPRLLVFMDDLTNWYVRMNRARLKGLRGREEALDSSAVLLQVLRTLTWCRMLCNTLCIPTACITGVLITKTSS